MNIGQIIQAARAAGNPREYLQSLARDNPAVGRALQMTAGKSPREVMQVAQNLAKEQGVDLPAFQRQIGLG